MNDEIRMTEIDKTLSLSPAILVFALSALNLGCEVSDPGSAGPVRTDSAGIQIVENGAIDRELHVDLKVEYKLGGAADGPESFYRLYPSDVSVGPDGRIAILNRDGYEVNVFDAEGEHLVSAGREGGGPGEFSYPSAVVALPHGTVAVYDYQKSGFEVFDSLGSHIGQESITVPYTGLRMVAGEGGRFLLSRETPPGGGAFTLQVMFLSETDTVSIGPRFETTSKPVFYESCGVRLTRPPVFSQDLSWSSTGFHTAVVGGPHYSIQVYDGTELMTIVRREITPRQATEELAKEELGDGEEWSIGGRECIVPPEEVILQRGLSELIPIISDVALSPRGQLWVKRRDVDWDGFVIDIFDEAGEYLGTVSQPVPFPVSFLPDGRAVAIETDSLDVQRVVVSSVEIDLRESG